MHFDKKILKNIFYIAAGCIVLYWILHEFERVKAVFNFIGGVLSPFVLGASLAFILNVPMRAIEKMLVKITNLTLRRVIALILTLLAVLLVLSLVFWLLIPELVTTVQALGPRLRSFAVDIEGWITSNQQIMDLVSKLNLGQSDWIARVGSMLTGALGKTVSIIGEISGAIMDIVIGIVFAIYCLFQKETLARQGKKLLYAYFPEKFSDSTIRILQLTNNTFSNFLSGQCLEVVILGCLFAVSMTIFRMPYAPLVSVVIAVTAFIPIVGAWVGCVLGTFLILVANPIQAIWFLVMFVVLQQIENNLIYPRVVGTSIGLSGMWVLVAVAIGGEIMGVAGMFLMIPVTSVLFTLLTEATNKRLEERQIDPEKLGAAPLETVRSRPGKRRRGIKTKENENHTDEN